MLKLVLSALIGAGIAALLTNLFVPLAKRIAKAAGAMDHPGGRKDHAAAIPRLGGLAIAVGLVAGGSYMLVLGRIDRLLNVTKTEMIAFSLATLLIFALGVVDDIVRVSAAKKFLVQIGAAGLLVAAGWGFERIRLPFGGEIYFGDFGIVVTILWIVGVTNAINLIDGLDGLAAGVVALIAASFVTYSLMLGHYFPLAVSSAVFGACLGFLRHNQKPARIFLGDSGSLTLGFLLAAISAHSATKAPAAVAILVPILALGVPIHDVLLVMLLRFLERPKNRQVERILRMFRADRQHLHHLMELLNLNRRRVVRLIYLMVFVFCAFSLVVAVTRRPELGLVLLVIEFLVVLTVRRMGLARAARTITGRKSQGPAQQAPVAAEERPAAG